MRTTPKLAAVLAIGLTATLALAACGSKREDTNNSGNGGGGGDASTGSDSRVDEAKKLLEDAGVSIPVRLSLQYNNDHYGDSSDQEYGVVKDQLDATGLFEVDLQSTEWVTYNEQRTSDYPAYQLGWFPDFPDADNYLTPFFEKENFLSNHFDSKAVQDLLARERVETDPTAREALLVEAQEEVAAELSTIPLLQGSQIAVTGQDMAGVDATMDASFQFRFSTFVKGGDPAAIVNVGTTDEVTGLDPAATYDNGSYLVQTNVFPMVMSFKQGDPSPQPDMAESCEFSADGKQFICKIRPGLKWANGHTLDANDVKFSYDRQKAIADPNGPSSLLANLVSTDAPDAQTVVFNLDGANDVTFAQVLASPVGPIVDDEVFSATEVTDADTIVGANAFAGAYTINTFEVNELIEYAPNPDYDGVQGKAQNGGVVMNYYKESNNMRLDIESGTIDVVWRSLTATDYEQLEAGGSVKVLHGPGGEIRYIVFNLETMPGDTDDQKLAIRKAVALSIDRAELASEVYKGTYTPLCSYVPDGLPGATEAVCDKYGGK
ncbi:MAG: ABC transporter substrate-binding protein [Bifidobacteriaceae bacterium]|jgi:ABC-type transport system substrate-binding protein|nr:ABC transporter substrate-binding protein [Bifidobacteriaceae bacterium]